MGGLLANASEFISEATYQGKLYLIEYYPGIIPSDNPKDLVYGDILKLANAELLNELDKFEGVGSEFPVPNEYRRELQKVILPDGSSKEAWVYLYNWAVKESNLIPSGDFLKYDS